MKRTDEALTDARERLLDAAEILFAEGGFEATSVRDITAEAKCNIAAVNYHFGGKDKLYHSAFSRLVKQLRDWRERRLRSDLDAIGKRADLEAALHSFVAAFMEEFESEERRRRMHAFLDMEMRNQHIPPEALFRELIQPVQQSALELLTRFGPRMEPETADLCIESLMGLLIHARKVRSLAHQGDGNVFYHGVSKEQWVSHIVNFAAGGIRACARASVRRPQQQRALKSSREGKRRHGRRG